MTRSRSAAGTGWSEGRISNSISGLWLLFIETPSGCEMAPRRGPACGGLAAEARRACSRRGAVAEVRPGAAGRGEAAVGACLPGGFPITDGVGVAAVIAAVQGDLDGRQGAPRGVAAV